MNNKVEAKWSGEYPNLCSGEWSLSVNGKDVTDKIPKRLRKSSMNTFGEYEEWHFVDWEDVWNTYTDGLECDDWIRENKDWLDTINTEISIQKEIYYAISEEDFRTGSCGGCI